MDEEKHLVYTELACRGKQNNLHFDWMKKDHIQIVTQDHSYLTLQRYQKVLGIGEILVCNHNLDRGDYALIIKGLEAYPFCKDILWYLAKHAPAKHVYCQQAIAAHENRQHQRFG